MHKCVNNSTANIYHLEQWVDKFFPYSREQLGFDRPVTIVFQSDEENASKMLGKTAHYDPKNLEVMLYVDNRHPKDVMRSLSHELVHHAQNCRGEFHGGCDKEGWHQACVKDTDPGYAQKDPHMRNMELEAYRDGNIIFRDFEDLIKTGKIKIEIDFSDSGEPKMSLKEWKDSELNTLLMKKWGLLKEVRTSLSTARPPVREPLDPKDPAHDPPEKEPEDLYEDKPEESGDELREDTENLIDKLSMSEVTRAGAERAMEDETSLQQEGEVPPDVARIVQKFQKLPGIQNYIKAINNITEFKTLISALYSLVTELDSFDDKKSAWVLKQVALGAQKDAADSSQEDPQTGAGSAEVAPARPAAPSGRVPPSQRLKGGTGPVVPGRGSMVQENFSVREARAISQRIIERIKKEIN